MGEEDDAGMKFTSKLFLKMKTRCRNKGDTLPSNTVTSTDLHLGGGGGTVANKHSSGGGGASGGHRNNNTLKVTFAFLSFAFYTHFRSLHMFTFALSHFITILSLAATYGQLVTAMTARRLRRRSTRHNTAFKPPVNSSYAFGL